MENLIFEIMGTFHVSRDTAQKVYNLVNAGASVASIVAVIVAATGPMAVGGAVVVYMIKKKIKGMAAAAAVAW
ncbi:circular bacteriocin, circularin A/uberolysin family [Heyndrickxia acidiproducens]|uniref:circular bacteriocin, circularin A/uberolysin family n=1 Tax=Heyndrickxia acidiproducens TaxID=1121084 RepID=UPI00037CFB58|nr:circular bacteriocin, circularin A/uberolysin family [Heyndrickxia acidiproducens]